MAANLASRALHNRSFVRAPIPLFEHGFGWLFGGRFLLLEHCGRTSGLPRKAVLEVIGHPAPDTYRVVSGLGRSAQWFRNVVRHSQVRVSIGFRRRAEAVAEVLPPGAGARALDDYARDHPAVWRTLSSVLAEHTEPGDENFASIPVVDIRLSGDHDADDAWTRLVGPAAALVALGATVLLRKVRPDRRRAAGTIAAVGQE